MATSTPERSEESAASGTGPAVEISARETFGGVEPGHRLDRDGTTGGIADQVNFFGAQIVDVVGDDLGGAVDVDVMVQRQSVHAGKTIGDDRAVGLVPGQYRGEDTDRSEGSGHGDDDFFDTGAGVAVLQQRELSRALGAGQQGASAQQNRCRERRQRAQHGSRGR